MADAAPTGVEANEVEALRFRLGFFKLVVRDLAAMERFYCDTFGFAVTNRVVLPGLEESMLNLPGQPFTLVLFHHTDGRTVTVGNGHGPVGLTTADLDAAAVRAIAHGARPLHGPHELPGARLTFLLDPEGHEIELIQRTGAPG
jgi:catechol 2,3-dioxygenase-like lactoylglutathione lyase family enzyme